jgi:hypothetical protein
VNLWFSGLWRRLVFKAGTNVSKENVASIFRVELCRFKNLLDCVGRLQRDGHVEFEVLTAVVMKSTIFWDITPRSPLKFNRRFGGTYCLHLQGRRISRVRYQRVNEGWLSTDYTALYPRKYNFSRWSSDRRRGCKKEGACSGPMEEVDKPDAYKGATDIIYIYIIAS